MLVLITEFRQNFDENSIYLLAFCLFCFITPATKWLDNFGKTYVQLANQIPSVTEHIVRDSCRGIQCQSVDGVIRFGIVTNSK